MKYAGTSTAAEMMIQSASLTSSLKQKPKKAQFISNLLKC